MSSVTKEVCETIMKTYLEHSDYKIVEFCTNKPNEASVGLMSYTELLIVNYIIKNDEKTINKVRFFVKQLPKNDYHLSVVAKCECFKKEAAFFGDIFKEMREFLLMKSIPTCYLKNSETMIVLENLIDLGFKNCPDPKGIDLSHTYAALKALADVQAACLLYEHKIGKTLDKVLSYELLRPWFTKLEDYPGYKDNMAGADIIIRIIDKYFTNYPDNAIEKAKQLCLNFCDNMQSSKKYRNVISHEDLWCNNIMFKYNEDGTVKDAILIDFQMYGYTPPSLDVLMIIYCNTEKTIRDKNLNDLLEFHYKCLADNISKHNVNPNSLLSKEEFFESIEETLPTALTSAPLFIHTVLIPEEYVYPVLEDPVKFKTYMEKDRSIVLEFMENSDEYKSRIFSAVEDLLDYCKK